LANGTPLTVRKVPKTNELTEREYNLVRLLDALGEEKRFLIFKNLQIDGSCYAEELADALMISRAATDKHARRLIETGLVKKKFVVEGGKARARLTPTLLARDVNACLEELIRRTGLGASHQEKAAEARARIRAIKAVLNKLERRLRSGEISHASYERFRQEYEDEMMRLEERIASVLKRVGAGSS